jgi:hypothetical protein
MIRVDNAFNDNGSDKGQPKAHRRHGLHRKRSNPALHFRFYGSIYKIFLKYQ